MLQAKRLPANMLSTAFAALQPLSARVSSNSWASLAFFVTLRAFMYTQFSKHCMKSWLLFTSLFVWLFVALPLQVKADNLFPFSHVAQSSAAEGTNAEPLPPDQAFKLLDPLYDDEKLLLRWEAAPDYYLYRHKITVKIMDEKRYEIGKLQRPHGKTKEDEFFGKIEALYQQIDVSLPLRVKEPIPQNLSLEIGWQGCAEKLGVCYPPEQRFYTASFTPTSLTEGIILQAVTAEDFKKIATGSKTSTTEPNTNAAPGTAFQSEQDQLAKRLANGNIFLTLLAFLGAGLLLALTPCVFPMIPILSSIITGQKNITTQRAFLLSLTYVLAMATTYTIAGVLAGLFGENLQATFQHPWILGFFSLIFVLLALSMFGFYELQLPNNLQSTLGELNNRQSGGTLLGVAIMGVLSALIVSPCVAAPLMAALIYIGQTGDAVLGGMALFALSIGMGVPLLIIGTGAGHYLPKAGSWMESVKALFGVLLLAVAIWMLGRILPGAMTLMLWAALLIFSAIYLGAMSVLAPNATGWQTFQKGAAILLLAWGLLQLVGATMGNQDPLQPLKGVWGVTANVNKTALDFREVNSLAELQTTLATAKGKPVMLDFYADWCMSCKKMEKYTFPAPTVQSALSQFVLLKADVTNNTAEHKALLQRFGLVGPPATVFFNTAGKEQKNLRLVGFIKAAPFAEHLGRVP